MKSVIALMCFSLLSFAPSPLLAGHHEAKAQQCTEGKSSCSSCGEKSCNHGDKMCESCSKEKKCSHCGAKKGHKKHHKDRSHGNFFLDHAEVLKLTPEQIAKLNEIRTKSEKQRMKLMHEKWALKSEYQEMAYGPNPNQKKLHRLADKLGKMKAKILRSDADHLIDSRKILTKEQIETLEGMYKKEQKK